MRDRRARPEPAQQREQLGPRQADAAVRRVPVSSCRKIAEPRPGTRGRRCTRRPRTRGRRRGARQSASLPPPNGGARPQATWRKLVVGRRARVLVPPVAADEPVVGQVQRRGSGRARRPSARSRTCRAASSRRPRGGGREAGVADARRPGAGGRGARIRAATATRSSTRGVGATTTMRCGHGRAATSTRASVSIVAQSTLSACVGGCRRSTPRSRPSRPRQLGARGIAGCPVGPAQLRRLSRLVRRASTARAHLGELVVNRAVTGDVTAVFRALYARALPDPAHAPIARYGGSDDRSMAADNTSAFNCRYAVAPGPEALVGARLRRGDRRQHRREPVPRGRARAPAGGRRASRPRASVPGWRSRGGALVRAFASVGWLWGGRWTGSPDCQHFSKTGG